MALFFEWDETKSKANLRKHGVSFNEAATVLGDELSLTVFDDRSDQEDPRWATVGTSRTGRLLVVVYTERGDRVRIISARPATPRERRQYEES